MIEDFTDALLNFKASPTISAQIEHVLKSKLIAKSATTAPDSQSVIDLDNSSKENSSFDIDTQTYFSTKSAV